MKVSLFFKRLFYAFIIGAICSIWYLQNNERFKEVLASRVEKVFQEKFDAVFSGTVVKINLFTLTVYFKDIEVVPYLEATSWHWKARSMSGSISLLSYFIHKKFGLAFIVDGYSLFSAIKEGRCVVEGHFKKIASQQNLTLPLFLDSIVFKNSSLLLASDDMSVGTTFSGYVFKNNQALKLKMQFLNGFFRKNINTLVMTDGFGSLQGTITPQRRMADISLHVDYQAQLPALLENHNEMIFKLDYEKGKGELHLSDREQKIQGHLEDILVTRENIFFRSTLSAPLFYIRKALPSLDKECMLNGKIHLKTVGSLKDTITGNIFCDDIAYHDSKISMISSSFIMHLFDRASGVATVETDKGTMKAHWQGSLKDPSYDLYFLNDSLLKRDLKDFWLIKPGALSGTITGSATSLKSSFNLFMQHEKTESTIPLQGTIVTDFVNNHTIKGMCDTYRYQLVYQDHKGSLEVVDHESKPVINGYVEKKEDHPDVFTTRGSISYDCIRPFLLYSFSLRSIGTGLFTWQGTYENKRFDIFLSAEDTAIRFSDIYNVFTGFSAQLSGIVWPFSCTMQNVLLSLHKGTIAVAQGYSIFDNHGLLVTTHLPIQLHNCLCNWKDAFLVELSGSCLLDKKENEHLKVETDIIIENGYLQENPLSLVNQKEFLHSIMPGITTKQADFEGIITIKTKDPFSIKTPYIESRALADIVCEYKEGKAQVTGMLKFVGGALHFPYKSVPLMHAELKFIKDHPSDPLIELIAEGMIKKYMINLTVGNSVQDPHIVLSSNPRLTEEQIVSLLFSGTAQESLNLVVPTLLMHNIEKFLFTKSHNYRAESSWLEPLKRIRIVPSFADQTGRGGLRAAIEIEVNDKLHGVIQKNFSLSEDTRIEVEYILSEDVSLKAIKDERSDLGAELEMRFSF